MTNRARFFKIFMDFVLLIGGIVVLIYFLPKVILFFWPIIVGYVIACVANPVVRFLEERIKIVPRHGSAIVIFMVILAFGILIYGIGYFIIWQLQDFIKELPNIYKQFEDGLDRISSKYSAIYEVMPKRIKDYIDSIHEGLDFNGKQLILEEKNSFNIARATVKGFTSSVISIIFAIMTSYMFIVQKDKILCRFSLIMSGRFMHGSRECLNKVKNVFFGYLKVQFKIMLVLVSIISIGFWLLGIKHFLIYAIFVGILDLLPLFGLGLVLLPWAIIQALVGEYMYALGLVLIYVVCLVIREVLEPKMFGKSIGLSTYETYFLLYVGYKVGGLVGLLFSIPFGVLLVSLIRSHALDFVVIDCKYMYVVADKFRRETKKSIINEIKKHE